MYDLVLSFFNMFSQDTDIAQNMVIYYYVLGLVFVFGCFYIRGGILVSIFAILSFVFATILIYGSIVANNFKETIVETVELKNKAVVSNIVIECDNCIIEKNTITFKLPWGYSTNDEEISIKLKEIK